MQWRMTSVTQLPAGSLDALTGSERDAFKRELLKELLQELRDPDVLNALGKKPSLPPTDPEDGHSREVAPLVPRLESLDANAAAAAPLPTPRRDIIESEAVTEMVHSHYTMTAWLLCPTHSELMDPENLWRTIGHGAVGMLAVIAQCLIVKALIADLIDQERWGNAADDLLGGVQGLDRGSSIIGREMPYCRSESAWNEYVEQQLLVDSVPHRKLCWPQEFCDSQADGGILMNVSLIDEANARFGFINNCWAGSGSGKDMSWMEIITDLVLTLFLGFEIYGEQQELFLQALLFHAVPKNNDLHGKGLSGYNSTWGKALYCFRLWCYTLFIGFRMYLIGLVSLASAILIVSDTSIAAMVLNGVALTFIVDFDNKLWKVGTWGVHSSTSASGGGYRAEYERLLKETPNIADVLKVQERATLMYASVAMVITFVVELDARHYGEIFNLPPDRSVGMSAFSAETVHELWANGVGWVSLYVVTAVVLLSFATTSLHRRSWCPQFWSCSVHPEANNDKKKTVVDGYTSGMTIVLILAGSLIATLVTDVLLLALAGRGEPWVQADPGESGSELSWTAKIVNRDNFALSMQFFWFLLVHFLCMVLLLGGSELILMYFRKGVATRWMSACFYGVASLTLVAFGVIILGTSTVV